MCRNFMKNLCFKSKKECNFAHHVEELRSTDEFYKTTLCKFFLNGYCKADTNCRHAHGHKELKYRSGNNIFQDSGNINNNRVNTNMNINMNSDDDNYDIKEINEDSENSKSDVNNKDSLNNLKSLENYSLNERKGRTTIREVEESVLSMYDMKKDNNQKKRENFLNNSRKLMSISTKDTYCFLSNDLSKDELSSLSEDENQSQKTNEDAIFPQRSERAKLNSSDISKGYFKDGGYNLELPIILKEDDYPCDDINSENVHKSRVLQAEENNVDANVDVNVDNKNISNEIGHGRQPNVTKLNENNRINYNIDMDNTSTNNHEYDNSYGNRDSNTQNYQKKKNFSQEYNKNGYKNRRSLNNNNNNSNNSSNMNNNNYNYNYNNSTGNDFNYYYNNVSKNCVNNINTNNSNVMYAHGRYNNNIYEGNYCDSNNYGRNDYGRNDCDSNSYNNSSNNSRSYKNSINNNRSNNNNSNNNSSNNNSNNNNSSNNNSSNDNNFIINNNLSSLNMSNNCISNNNIVDNDTINYNNNIGSSNTDHIYNYTNNFRSYNGTMGNVNRYMNTNNFPYINVKQNNNYDITNSIANNKNSSTTNSNNNCCYNSHDYSPPTLNNIEKASKYFRGKKRIAQNCMSFETRNSSNLDNRNFDSRNLDNNLENIIQENNSSSNSNNCNMNADGNHMSNGFNFGKYVHNPDNHNNRHRKIYNDMYINKGNNNGNSNGNNNGYNNASNVNYNCIYDYDGSHINTNNTCMENSGNTYYNNIDPILHNNMYNNMVHNNVYNNSYNSYKGFDTKTLANSNISGNINSNSYEGKQRKNLINNNAYNETCYKDSQENSTIIINKTKITACNNTNLNNETNLSNDNMLYKNNKYYSPRNLKNEKIQSGRVLTADKLKKHNNDELNIPSKILDHYCKSEKEYKESNNREQNTNEEKGSTLYYMHNNNNIKKNTVNTGNEHTHMYDNSCHNICEQNCSSSNYSTFKTLTSFISPLKGSSTEERARVKKQLVQYDKEKKENVIMEKNKSQNCILQNNILEKSGSHNIISQSTNSEYEDTPYMSLQNNCSPDDISQNNVHERNSKSKKYSTNEQLKTCVSCYQYIKKVAPFEDSLIELSCLNCGQLIKKSLCQMIIELLKPQVQYLISDINFYVQYYQD
ncbi:zinc finger protein, putative [Plasmodium malariae]|uniref:Zinc finger protein, putative n=1 Tax=Plasmodium malariae TaxID=5858 RepID=A0A1C3KDH1_PLAMA|nr:zinc finger protein, putative [Plasmodium malariae]